MRGLEACSVVWWDGTQTVYFVSFSPQGPPESTKLKVPWSIFHISKIIFWQYMNLSINILSKSNIHIYLAVYMYTIHYWLTDYQPGDIWYSAFFIDYWNQCFFYAVANEINRVKNAIQNVVEWKYTVAENGNPQANYKCTGSIQNSLNLDAI